uniref:EF-hand domain-containing protein n=1 Tax=Globodera rostochiensis TaxID=31243 RepID=A0A914IEW6_GLORO
MLRNMNVILSTNSYAAAIGGRRPPLFSQLSSSSTSSSSSSFTISSSRPSTPIGPRTPLFLEPKMSVLVEDELEDVGAEHKLLGEKKFNEWEQRLWQWGQAEEQANRLFKLCDKDHKGFIVRADLERLNNTFIPSGLSFALLEHAFELGDRHRVNLVYEKDFLRVIKSILTAQNIAIDQMDTRFRTISLGHDGEKKYSSGDDDWSPAHQKVLHFK